MSATPAIAAALSASLTAKPDQIELYGIVDATRLALEFLVKDICDRGEKQPRLATLASPHLKSAPGRKKSDERIGGFPRGEELPGWESMMAKKTKAPTAVELAALAIIEAMPREQIVVAIDQISATLKGHGVSFRDRLELNDERHALRARLAQIDAEARP
jgi:hypothetical protein